MDHFRKHRGTETQTGKRQDDDKVFRKKENYRYQ